MDAKEKIIITIGRQFGSGGRELGKNLAEKCGLDYYDKKLLIEGAAHAGMSQEFFENRDEKMPSFFSGMIPPWVSAGSASWYGGMCYGGDDSTYSCQCEVIRKIADKGSCVIVGRSADYVLRSYPNVVNIFVHAPIEVCAKRIADRGEAPSVEAAIAKAKKINKLRANYYNFYTDKEWGNASSYDLTFDSSKITADSAVEVIRTYVKMRFGIDL